MMMAISTVFLRLSKRADAEELRRGLWTYLKERDPALYPRVRSSLLGVGVNLPGAVGRALTRSGYRIARSIFRFN
jgi:hypothetical protein